MKEKNPLGKNISHAKSYDPSQLFPIEREEARSLLSIDTPPFTGSDIWNCYELSWLNASGKPGVGIGRFIIPFESKYIVESKSMKLYLNSFNLTGFDSVSEVKKAIENDLSNACGSDVEVSIILPESFNQEKIHGPKGICIDSIDIKMESYRLSSNYLKTGDNNADELLYSNLLRTNCPVTSQPDWATLFIKYTGKEIEKASLLKYIVSFREHSGFHENCVETIFVDIMRRCKPEKLLVNARFTRRGGIDINPYRSNYGVTLVDERVIRQ
jgi:7-cyano-7-deazaguanine reductase